MSKSFFSVLSVASLVALVFAGCSHEAKKARLLERADRDFKAGQYDQAKIEYLNVMRLDHLNAAAIQQLGMIWFEEGAPLRALPFLLKARELSPQNLDVRMKLASAFLSVGHLSDARKEALAILQQSQDHDEAIRLLADTAASKADIESTEQQLQKLPSHDTASFHLASATLLARKGDMASAKTAVNHALALDPKSPAAHLAAAGFGLFEKDVAQAGQELKVAADLSPIRSSTRLKYAEFQFQTGAADKASAFLKEMTRQAPDYLPAWRLLAQIALAGKKYDESLALLENIFNRDPQNLDSRMLQAEAWIAKGEPGKAVESLERLDKTNPKQPAIKYLLARAYLQNNSRPQAIAALNQALAANPDYVQASLLLAELNLRAGDPQTAVASMLELLKKHPNVARAQLLLAEAYRSAGRLDDAAGVLREQAKSFPSSAEPHFLLGRLLRQQDKAAEARQSFEKALELAPEDMRILFQIVELDIREKDFASALQRVRRQLGKTPKSAAAQFMEAKVYYAQGDWDRAEAALLKTLDLDANFSAAYDPLISIYLSANKLAPAIHLIQAWLAINPGNPQALMMSGGIYQKMGDFAKARDAYEKLLAVSPNSVPAVNNLAYLYDAQLKQPDKAYDLAQKARTLQPGDPHVADTLGWILYRRGDYQQALAILQESAGKLPSDPEIQFHLGMASYMMGQTESALTALRQAAAAPEDFPGKADIPRQLALLDSGPGKSMELPSEELEAMLKTNPNDPVALVRLGESFEKKGAFAKAAATYDRALNVNPNLLAATTKLAQLNAGPLQNQDKALELARKARALAPRDPLVAGRLGGIAYQTGNFAWAYSLLQESARQLPNETRILRDLGWAAYSLGKVSEAQQTMHRVLDAGPDPGQSDEAKSFLAMTALEQNPKDAITAGNAVEAILKTNPQDVPALMVRAAIQAQRGELTAAISTYIEVLRRFPDFGPAQKRLASLYLEDPVNTAKAYELATKARKTLPDDPELAIILAQISYQRKEFTDAVRLFQESAQKSPLDAKSLYYLGLAHVQTKGTRDGRQALEQALALGLQEPFSGDAKRVLAGLAK